MYTSVHIHKYMHPTHIHIYIGVFVGLAGPSAKEPSTYANEPIIIVKNAQYMG